MRYIFPLAAIVFLFSCNESESKKVAETTQTDSVKKETEIAPKVNEQAPGNKHDSASVIKMADEIMKAAATKDYQKFASFIHPEKGVELGEKKCSATELLKMAKEKKKFDFGTGYAEPEKLTVDEFFKYEFLDLDHTKGVTKSFNNLHRGPDASPGIMRGLSPDHDIVEYFYNDTKNELLWGATRLYFEWKDNTPYLVSTEYDHWLP